MDDKCADEIVKLLKRKLPDQLTSLNLLFCKQSWQVTESVVGSLMRS